MVCVWTELRSTTATNRKYSINASRSHHTFYRTAIVCVRISFTIHSICATFITTLTHMHRSPSTPFIAHHHVVARNERTNVRTYDRTFCIQTKPQRVSRQSVSYLFALSSLRFCYFSSSRSLSPSLSVYMSPFFSAIAVTIAATAVVV